MSEKTWPVLDENTIRTLDKKYFEPYRMRLAAQELPTLFGWHKNPGQVELAKAVLSNCVGIPLSVEDLEIHEDRITVRLPFCNQHPEGFDPTCHECEAVSQSIRRAYNVLVMAEIRRDKDGAQSAPVRA